MNDRTNFHKSRKQLSGTYEKQQNTSGAAVHSQSS
jgi:hypothetical protein